RDRDTFASFCMMASSQERLSVAAILLRRQPRRFCDLFRAHAIIDQELAELLRRVHHRLERALDHMPISERWLARDAHDLTAQLVDDRARGTGGRQQPEEGASVIAR